MAVSICYCSRCNWMLRSAWLSQELLTTFNGTLTAVTLQPDHSGSGCFTVVVDKAGQQTSVWDRADEGRFPEAKELKQRVRDAIDPDRSLGHSDSDAADDAPAPPKTARTAVQRLLTLLRGGGTTPN